MNQSLSLYVQLGKDRRSNWGFTPRVVKVTSNRPAEIEPDAVLVKLRLTVPSELFARPVPVLDVELTAADVEHPPVLAEVERP